MTGTVTRRASGANPWRIAGWSIAAFLLLLPLVAMQFTKEVQWTASDFVFAGVLIGSVGLGLELAVRASGDISYRLGCALALVTGFLIIWINAAVGVFGESEHPLNLLMMGVVALALSGSIGAGFRASGMTRAMLTAAAGQGVVALIGCTGPVAQEPPGLVGLILLNGIFIALWLVAALLFHKTALQEGDDMARGAN